MTQYVMQTLAAGYLGQALVTFFSSAAAFMAIILIWRHVANRDAQRALDGQEAASREIQRLKAALWDAERSNEGLARENAGLRRLAREARNHNRNWNARAGEVLRVAR